MLCVALVALLISSGFAGTIVQRSDTTQQAQQPQSQQSTPVQNAVNNQLQTYSSSQASQLPTMQYQYPSYPDYSDNTHPYRSGLEGYLVPISPPQDNYNEWSPGLATSLIPLASSVMTYGAQIGTYLLHFLLALFVGGIITTLVCTFTSICSISFLGLTFNNSQVKEQVADLARTYITPESVNAATVLVTKAIDKYNAMQREKREKSKQE